MNFLNGTGRPGLARIFLLRIDGGMKKIIVLLSAMLLPSFAAAQSCAPSTAADIPAFEQAKTAFYRTDYRAFANLIGDYIPDLEERFDALFDPLAVFEPQGYDRCRTILQRREEPSFFQEIVFFFPKGNDVPIALYLAGAEVDGDIKILEFSYNSAITEVLDSLR